MDVVNVSLTYLRYNPRTGVHLHGLEAILEVPMFSLECGQIVSRQCGKVGLFNPCPPPSSMNSATKRLTAVLEVVLAIQGPGHSEEGLGRDTIVVYVSLQAATYNNAGCLR